MRLASRCYGIPISRSLSESHAAKLAGAVGHPGNGSGGFEFARLLHSSNALLSPLELQEGMVSSQSHILPIDAGLLLNVSLTKTLKVRSVASKVSNSPSGKGEGSFLYFCGSLPWPAWASGEWPARCSAPGTSWRAKCGKRGPVPPMT